VYPEWVKPFAGKFDQGWDKLREEIYARQKKLGVIPQDALLTPRHESIPAWATLTPERKRLAARLMEIYSGFLAHTDFEAGRLVASLREMNEWDNTLFVYIVGDNGAAPAGGIEGVFNEMVTLNGLREDPAVVMSRLDQLGGPKANNEYPVGFAWAMDTPFQFTKQFASHLGGTRNPMVVTWPARIKDRGGLRSQFHHLVDIAPTVYEAAGIPAPKRVDGIEQLPLDGISMLYTFDKGVSEERRKTQYFEIQGRRGIYHDGWLAGTRHDYLTWQRKPLPRFDKDRWELYHLDSDFSQAIDVAEKEPARLAELQRLFMEEARENRVFPLDDRGPARAINARPTIMGKRESIRLSAGSVRLPEDIIRTFFNRSYAIKAVFSTPPAGQANGVLLASGGYFAGLSLYVKGSRPCFTYNYFGSSYTTLCGASQLPKGKAVTLRMEFDYEGMDLGLGGNARLIANGKTVAEKRIPRTVPLGFSADETVDVGIDTGTPAADTYEGAFAFNGKIEVVEIVAR
jgi:arylsulfatase